VPTVGHRVPKSGHRVQELRGDPFAPVLDELCFSRRVSRSPASSDDVSLRLQGPIAHVRSLEDRAEHAVCSAWVSADHGAIVTVDEGRAVRWFDVASGRFTGETQADAVVGAARGGAAPLLLGGDGAITAWTPAGEGERLELGLSIDDLGAISSDARYVVEQSFGSHEDARLWDRARGSASTSLAATAGAARYAFDEETRVLLAHGRHSTSAFDLDAPDARPSQTLVARAADKVLAASRSLLVYDEYMMLCVQRIRASRGEGDVVSLEALSTAEIVEAVPVHSLVAIARVAERWASSGAPYGRVSIFDGRGVEQAAIDLSARAERATALALSDDGMMLAVGTSSGVTHVFELPPAR
jgi:hypothetical protein